MDTKPPNHAMPFRQAQGPELAEGGAPKCFASVRTPKASTHLLPLFRLRPSGCVIYVAASTLAPFGVTDRVLH